MLYVYLATFIPPWDVGWRVLPEISRPIPNPRPARCCCPPAPSPPCSLQPSPFKVPGPQVPVRAAAKVVWAAARLGISSERLVPWVLSSCQEAGKLAGAPPRCLAHLCWGLAKLSEWPRVHPVCYGWTGVVWCHPSGCRPAREYVGGTKRPRPRSTESGQQLSQHHA